jgi:peptidoglycan/LPS O-acetylase OafA/YrhL
VYVFHAFALPLNRFGVGGLHPLVRFVVYLGFTLVVSWLSWVLFEARLNALKSRYPYAAERVDGGDAQRRAA